jgi:hypothetical protein
MAIAVSVIIISSVGAPLSAALKVRMFNINAGVDTIDYDALTSSRVIHIVGSTGLLARDAREAP